MGISMYQRFTLNEASLFLHCTKQIVTRLVKEYKLNYIQITEIQVEFFGYQLLQYLLQQTPDYLTPKETKTSYSASKTVSHKSRPDVDRIVRSKELQNITDLSITTICRLKNKG